MADFGTSTDPVQRYAAIEKAYTEDRWEAVIEKGTVLLNDLPWISGGAPDGLKERIQLLVAHAHLYGFSQREQAQRLYQAVIGSGGEPALVQIAEQGLEQCMAMPAAIASEGVNEEAAPSEEVVASEEIPASEEVTPLAAVETVSPPTPEAPEDPAASPASPAWASTSAPATPANAGAAEPVMPWLTTGQQPAVQSQAQPAETVGAAPETSEPAAPTTLSMAPVAAADPVVPDDLGEADPAPAAPLIQAPLIGERLIPEVIEEPELIEIHQADPQRAEDVVVAVRESLAAADDQTGAPQTSTPVMTSATPETPPSQPDIVIRTHEEPAEASTPTAGLGVGVFRNPPAPVTREDPELLMGLLRVQIG